MIVANAPVEVFDEIDSTMLEARRRADRGDFGPVWLMAKRQNAGRGRRGRAWVSESGNLYVTYLFQTERAVADLALLGFAAGLAICDAIDAEVGYLPAQLKWPNDVLVDGAKAAGLMLDSGVAPSGVRWAALGIGVNLVSSPHAIDQPTTFLAAHEEPTTPEDFLGTLRLRLADWDGVFEREGFEPLRAAWLARAHGLGREARVAQGESSVQGRIVGLSSRGELELDTGDGVRLIAAGDVLLSNPQPLGA